MADTKDDKPEPVYGRRASIVRVFHVPANIVRHLRHGESAQGGGGGACGRQSPRPQARLIGRPIGGPTAVAAGGAAGASSVTRQPPPPPQQQQVVEIDGNNGNNSAGMPPRHVVNVTTREVTLPSEVAGARGDNDDGGDETGAKNDHEHGDVPGIPLRRSTTRTPLNGNPVFSSLIPLDAQEESNEQHPHHLQQQQLQQHDDGHNADQKSWLHFDPYGGVGMGSGGGSNTRAEKTFFDCQFQDNGLYPVSERSWESSLPDVTEGLVEAGEGTTGENTRTKATMATNASHDYHVEQQQQQGQQHQQMQQHKKPTFPPPRPEALIIPEQSIELPASPVYLPRSTTPLLVHHQPRSRSLTRTSTTPSTATSFQTTTTAGGGAAAAAENDRCCSLKSSSTCAAGTAAAAAPLLPPLQARRLDDSPVAAGLYGQYKNGRDDDGGSSLSSDDGESESSTIDSFDLSVPGLPPPIKTHHSHINHNTHNTTTSPISATTSPSPSPSSPRITKHHKFNKKQTPFTLLLKKPFNLEQRSEQLFSIAHLHVILSDAGFLERFRQYVVAYRSTEAVATLGYAVDALKALRAMEWMNAVMKGSVARFGAQEGLLGELGRQEQQQQKQQQQQQNLGLAIMNGGRATMNGHANSNPDMALFPELTTNEVLRQKATAAFEILARDELPAYITHVWAEIVEASVRQRIMGRMSAHLVERSEGLAEVFCLTDPGRADCPIVFASEEFHRTTHFGPDHVLGRNCRFLQGPKTNRSAAQRIGEMMKAVLADHNKNTSNAPIGEHYETILNYRRDGLPFMNLVMITPLLDARGKVRYFLGAQVDVSGLAKDCSGLESLRRLVDREEREGSGYEHGHGHGQQEAVELPASGDSGGGLTTEPTHNEGKAFRSLAEMLSPGEIETVRLCGGRIQAQAQPPQAQHDNNKTKDTTASQPWVGRATPLRIASPPPPAPPKAAFREVTDALGNVTISVGADSGSGSGSGSLSDRLRNNNSSVANLGYSNANSNNSTNNMGRNGTNKTIPLQPPRPIFQNYLIVRPYPSLRILFASPSLRIPGMLQSHLMSRVGGSQRIRDELEGAFAAGRSVTAKVRWISGRISGGSEKGKGKMANDGERREGGGGGGEEGQKKKNTNNKGSEKSASTSASTGSTSIASVTSASSSSCCSASTSTARTSASAVTPKHQQQQQQVDSGVSGGGGGDRTTTTTGRPRWMHCTPLLGAYGEVGVWVVVIVDDEDDALQRGEGEREYQHQQVAQQQHAQQRREDTRHDGGYNGSVSTSSSHHDGGKRNGVMMLPTNGSGNGNGNGNGIVPSGTLRHVGSARMIPESPTSPTFSSHGGFNRSNGMGVEPGGRPTTPREWNRQNPQTTATTAAAAAAAGVGGRLPSGRRNNDQTSPHALSAAMNMHINHNRSHEDEELRRYVCAMYADTRRRDRRRRQQQQQQQQQQQGIGGRGIWADANDVGSCCSEDDEDDEVDIGDYEKEGGGQGGPKEFERGKEWAREAGQVDMAIARRRGLDFERELAEKRRWRRERERGLALAQSEVGSDVVRGGFGEEVGDDEQDNNGMGYMGRVSIVRPGSRLGQREE